MNIVRLPLEQAVELAAKDQQIYLDEAKEVLSATGKIMVLNLTTIT